MWFMGAKENKVSLICFIPLNYYKLLQTIMSLGTTWICLGRQYPSMMCGESSTALEQRLQTLDLQISWWMKAVVWK